MPAMRLFGRRWAMGTDDVPLLAFPVALFQLLWASALAAAVAVAARRWRSEDARKGSDGACDPSVAVPYMAALGGLLSTAVVAAALALWSTWEGLKGSILDVDLRKRVPPLVYSLVASLAVETGFLVFATVLASRPLPECAAAASPSLLTARHPWAAPAVAVRALVFVAWGVLAVLALVAAATSAAAPDPADEAAWASRCRCLVVACCPAAAVPGGRATETETKRRRRRRRRGGAVGPEAATAAGAATTDIAAAAAAAAVASSSATAASKPSRWSPRWPFGRRRGRRRRTSSRSLDDRGSSCCSSGSEGTDGDGSGDDSEDDEENDGRRSASGGGDPEPPYQRLGILFKQLLGHLDLVPTDIFAAFLLEARLQQAERAAGTLGALQEEEAERQEEREGEEALLLVANRKGGEGGKEPSAPSPRQLPPSIPRAPTPDAPPTRPTERSSPLSKTLPPPTTSPSDPVAPPLPRRSPSPAPFASSQQQRPLRSVSPALRRSQQAIRDAAAVADFEVGGGGFGDDVERAGTPPPPSLPSASMRRGGGSSGSIFNGSGSSSPARSPWNGAGGTSGGEERRRRRRDSPSPSPPPRPPTRPASGSNNNLLAPRPGLFARSSSHQRLSALPGSAAGAAPSGETEDDDDGPTTTALPLPPPRAPTPPPPRMLTPSGMAASLRPDLDPAEAALLASSRAERCELAEVGAAAHVAHFAFAAYGYLLYLWSRPRHRGPCELMCGGGSEGNRGCLLARCVGGAGGASLSDGDDVDSDEEGELDASAVAPDARGRRRLDRLTGTKALTRAAILSITGVDPRDLLFVRFRSDARLSRRGATTATTAVPLLPYFVAVDRPGPARTHGGARLPPAIVVAIRGTLSASDVLTDALCEAERCDGWLDADDVDGGEKGTSPPSPLPRERMYAHSGILAAAKAVAADLEAEGVVERALVAERAKARKAGGQDERGAWRVVVTGHSLGAGVASLVALRLRSYLRRRAASGALSPAIPADERAPDVACWAFAPPGGLACPALAAAVAAEGLPGGDERGKRETDKTNGCRIVSVAVGKDWIPRLSLSAVERLRDDMVVAAARCSPPKALLLLGWAAGYRWPASRLFRPASEVSGKARELVGAFRETLSSRAERERKGGGDGGDAPSSSAPPSPSASTAAAARSDREARLDGARSFVAPGRFMLLRPLKASAKAAADEKNKRREKSDGDVDVDGNDVEAPPPPPPAPLPRHARAFEAVWVDHSDLEREGILLSTRMALDHLPDYYLSVLRRISRGEYDSAGGGCARPVSSLGPWDGTMMPPRGLSVAPPPTSPPRVALRGRRLSVGEGEATVRRAAALEMQRRREERRGERRASGGAAAPPSALAAVDGRGSPTAVPSAFGSADDGAAAAAPRPSPQPSLRAFGSYFPPAESSSPPPPTAVALPTTRGELADLARRVSSHSEAEALADGETFKKRKPKGAPRMRRDASRGLLSRAEEGG